MYVKIIRTACYGHNYPGFIKNISNIFSYVLTYLGIALQFFSHFCNWNQKRIYL